MVSITESINKNTYDIDIKSGEQIAKLINEEDQNIAKAVEKNIPQIGYAIEIISEKIKQGGRLAYFGCGTSGRIGILDASEMPPTYGVSKNLFNAYIAGGNKAIRFAIENAEDSDRFALQDYRKFAPQKNDVIICISASGNPQYLIKIMQLAKKDNIFSIVITSNPRAKLKSFADLCICVNVGAEVITGSSRMKSGTAQKMILNMISTGIMIKVGKVYHNYMVDLQVTNDKLYKRAIRLIMDITGVNEKDAIYMFSKSKNVKIACVAIIKKCSIAKAKKILLQNGNILRNVI